jgi:hypothetical protein
VLGQLEQHGTFAEVQHHRAPIKFTSEVMAAAQRKLLEMADTALTTGDLVLLLEQAGVLTAPTDHHNFLVHFKEHLAGQDLTLQVGATDTIFRITEESAAERYIMAGKLLELVPTDAALQNFIYVDETTFEESPHPKGKCQRHMPSASAVLARGWWAGSPAVWCPLHKALHDTMSASAARACAACTATHGLCCCLPPCSSEACAAAAAHQGADGPT